MKTIFLFIFLKEEWKDPKYSYVCEVSDVLYSIKINHAWCLIETKKSNLV